MERLSSERRGHLAFAAIVVFAYCEMAAFLLVPVGEPVWPLVFFSLRVLEVAVPIALILGLSGWQRLALLPGALVKLLVLHLVTDAIPLGEMLQPGFTCQQHAGEAGHVCSRVLGVFVPAVFWTIASLELAAYGEVRRRETKACVP